MLANYFYYYPEKSKQTPDNILYTIVEAQLTNLMINGLEYDEKFMLLQNAIRTILSSVPADQNLFKSEKLEQKEISKLHTFIWKHTNPL